MLKVLCVCGCGLGSSFAIEMSAKSVLKKLGIDAEINHTTISEASAFRYDVILTQKIFADILTSDASEDEKKRIIILNKLTDKDEIEEKILAYIQAHK
ncbi:PTS sugar transporter subunit IIB [Pectobacterium aroidearum]|uniref:PTS sugar transporter subunit IIB n=1 Tax=Pectobacterium aroidearum TaxID=1201031 RepID=A0ABR5Z8R0_9GAMM|nr:MULTISPECIES: PTS sugar transporter subunit IIB [Pectobacterium]MBA5198168.1 PTS sugar transporter subunit IIB [Pectobacterium aroidearum]MBA5227328.1 PTS sugar transporter subunit IIB [Pectobacterium aroidearum]MBA5230961.1 PTS sugar transporter subunit IIB [Pectobacterium aroidearum]MBA5736107.1 PTS sugar transporter subunit IIB [Pectobacterium aroidearum]UXK02251.1 PTS sugar transporter subunit IIB [Pectobacterium aroidearum]